jgi:hypothetical protein
VRSERNRAERVGSRLRARRNLQGLSFEVHFCAWCFSSAWERVALAASVCVGSLRCARLFPMLHQRFRDCHPNPGLGLRQWTRSYGLDQKRCVASGVESALSPVAGLLLAACVLKSKLASARWFRAGRGAPPPPPYANACPRRNASEASRPTFGMAQGTRWAWPLANCPPPPSLLGGPGVTFRW